MEEYATKLRKQKRNQQITSKRTMRSNIEDTINDERLRQLLNDINPLLVDTLIDTTKSKEESITYTFEILDKQDLEHQKALLIFIRKVLSRGEKYLGTYIFKKGYLPKLLKYLEGYEEEIYLNMAWALTNIVADSDDAIRYLRAYNIHYILVDIAIKGNNKVKEQTLWILGNIISESIQSRDELLSTPLVETLIDIVSMEALSLSFLNVTCWVISMLCKGKESPAVERVKGFFPLLARLIHIDETSIVSDVLWTFAYLTASNKSFIPFTLEHLSINNIFSLIKNPDLAIKRPCTRIIGNICLGDSKYIDDILNNESTPSIFNALLNETESELIRETAWCISNIAADSKNRVDYLISIEMVSTLALVLKKAALPAVQKEVFWCLANMIKKSNYTQIMQLINQGIMELITEFLAFNDVQFAEIAVNLIEVMLRSGAKAGGVNKHAARFEEIGGTNMLELLQYKVY